MGHVPKGQSGKEKVICCAGPYILSWALIQTVHGPAARSGLIFAMAGKIQNPPLANLSWMPLDNQRPS